MRNCKILIGLCKRVFVNRSVILLDQGKKIKLVPASFSCFLDYLWTANNRVTILTVIMSPYYNETNN